MKRFIFLIVIVVIAICSLSAQNNVVDGYVTYYGIQPGSGFTPVMGYFPEAANLTLVLRNGTNFIASATKTNDVNGYYFFPVSLFTSDQLVETDNILVINLNRGTVKEATVPPWNRRINFNYGNPNPFDKD